MRAPTTASSPGRSGILCGAYNSDQRAAAFELLSRPERLETALAGAERLHPGFRGKVFAENGFSIAWGRMPYPAGAWANDTFETQPDVFSAMADADPIGRRIFMAVDAFSLWPGWQVAALGSAHLATDSILRLVTSQR